MGFLEGDQAAGELEQGEVVLVLFGPADEDRAVAVEPGVSGLDDPPSGPPAGSVCFEPDLLAARSDVRGETVFSGELADRRDVVGAVKTETLRLGSGRFGPLDRDRLDRLGEELQIVAVGAFVRDPDRDPCGLGEKRTLRPLFALSVGFGPVFGPPSGALVIAPSAASQSQSTPTTLS